MVHFDQSPIDLKPECNPIRHYDNLNQIKHAEILYYNSLETPRHAELTLAKGYYLGQYSNRISVREISGGFLTVVSPNCKFPHKCLMPNCNAKLLDKNKYQVVYV